MEKTINNEKIKTLDTSIHSEFSSVEIDSQITIKSEFINFCDSLTSDEYGKLKNSIKQDGCLHPLIVDENFNLLDGCHRLKICRELNMPYTVKQICFTNEDDKLLWVALLQFSGRNNNDLQKSNVRGKLYNVQKISKEQKGNQYTKLSRDTMTLSKIDTAQYIADKFNVSRKTVIRDGKMNKSLSALETEMVSVLSEKDAVIIREKITQQLIPITKNNLERISDKPVELFNTIINFLVKKHEAKENDKVIGKEVNKLIRDLCKKKRISSEQGESKGDISKEELTKALGNINLDNILAECNMEKLGFFRFENDKIKINFFVK